MFRLAFVTLYCCDTDVFLDALVTQRISNSPHIRVKGPLLGLFRKWGAFKVVHYHMVPWNNRDHYYTQAKSRVEVKGGGLGHCTTHLYGIAQYT